MTEPVTKLRICEIVGCSGPANWDYIPDGKWYCNTHIAQMVFNQIIHEGNEAMHGFQHVSERQATS